MRSLLRYAKVGLRPEKQFMTVGLRLNRESFKYILLLYATLLATRLAGHRLHRPVVAQVGEAGKVARWLASKVAAGTPAVFGCHTAGAVRICLAAEEQGLDLTGTLFLLGGEPYTPAKARMLARAGATATVRYAMGETSMIGVSCATREDIDDVHLLEAKVAMIHREHITPAGDTVQALIYTTVLSSNPKLLLNLYSGDYATVTHRECSCFLGDMGMTTHLSTIRSYEKLTGDGVTFIGSQLFNLVEDILPRRFGGSLQDYQLVEEESDQGITRLSIVVAPGVGQVDEAAVIRCVLENLEATHHGGGGALMAEIWRQGQTLRVVRRAPDERGGKVAPLRLLPRSSEQSSLEPATPLQTG